MPDLPETPPTETPPTETPPTETPPTEIPPLNESSSLRQKSLALGEVLHALAESDPGGVPSEAAAAAFGSWLDAAGAHTHKPDFFADVRANYAVRGNSNKDLFDLFELLGQYVAVEDEAEPEKAFIGLPMLGGGHADS